MKTLLKMTAVSLVCAVAAGCNAGGTRSESGKSFSSSGKYFSSPESAVEQITVMLKAKSWPELAKYYDLSDSPIDMADLVSGEFFYTDKEPEVRHPAGFWKYKHPFAPAFTFRETRELEEPGVIEVTVGVEIDQGGGMIQRGMQTFLMRKSDKGYQVMPHKAPVL